MTIKYDNKNFDPEKLDKENIDRMAIDQVPFGSSVLEIGCATGFMGEYLIKKKNCRITGVEMRQDEAKIAGKRLNKVIIGDIEDNETFYNIKEKFDVVLATSLIEHLRYPEVFLKRIRKILVPNGLIIMTTPNIAHWSVRLSLLRGKFEYSKYGILDETHLHFYTLKTFNSLFLKNGFISKKKMIDSVGGGYPRISRFLSKFFPNIFAYQILIVAKQKK